MIVWSALTAPLIVAGGSLLALLIDAFLPHRSWKWPSILGVVALAAAGVQLVWTGGSGHLSLALSLIVVIGTLLVLFAAAVMDHEDSMPPGELHFLLLASASGAMCLVIARDLVTLVVALELLSIPSIAMVGLRRGDPAAARGAWTFFLVSAVSTAVTLMGISLVYGIAGTVQYDELQVALTHASQPDRVVHTAVLLTLIGFLFKAGSVPFHMWIPDTYRGASVAVAAFLSVVSKAGAFGALLGVLAGPFVGERAQWAPFIGVLAALSMTIGNIGALGQRDMVGLLAWSSIAQSGFILASMVAIPDADGLAAPIRYLAIYALANLVAFTAIGLIRRRWGGTSFAHGSGMIRRDVWIGAPMAFALLSLAGFPPAVIGLFAKYLVLRPVVDSDYGWLAAVMAVNVAIGLVYYLRLIVVLFAPATGESRGEELSPSPPYAVRVAFTAMITGAAVLVVASAAPNVLLSWLP